MCNYANDNTVFACHADLETVTQQLEDDCSLIVKWFSDTFLQLNDEKCYLMIFGNKSTGTTRKLESQKLRRVTMKIYWKYHSTRS